ncbi:ABC transporter ATP-binding protein [bacterium]|nr:ABC transporter ATP-binding protein [bacterium]
MSKPSTSVINDIGTCENHIAALEIENLTKTFRKDADKSKNGKDKPRGLRRLLPRAKTLSRVVDSVSFTVKPGEVFGVLGPNGSGKSTLIRIISTLLLPDEGNVQVFGHDVMSESDTVRRMISRVSADAAFFRRLSAMENLIHTARLYSIPVKLASERIKDMLSRLEMNGEKLETPMLHLSRGMQQKVAITRAFITLPNLLLLDEPTTGLDPKSKREVQRFVHELKDSDGSTVLLTTHDMEEAEVLCDRIAVLNSGKIVAIGTPDELKEQYGGQSGTLESVFFTLAGKSIEEMEEDQS